MARPFLLALLLASSSAGAIVTRDDVDDSKYRVRASDFPALADLPGEGHGVLISPQWVITAAHAIMWQSEINHIVLNGTSRDVERLVVHPGYQKPPQELLDHALATWDWTLFTALLASSDDIALLKLAQPVTDVSPVAIYQRDDEFGIRSSRSLERALRVTESPGTTSPTPIVLSFAVRITKSRALMAAGSATCSTSRRKPCPLRADREVVTAAGLSSSRLRRTGSWRG